MILFAALAVFAFLLGSVPFGLLIGRIKGVDVRQQGSGNIGATNAMRALGTGYGLLVFALDLLKGLLPVLLGRFFLADTLFGLDQQPLLMLLGTFAVLGHSFSPWVNFRGGKGISTSLGVGLGAVPLCALLAFAVMLVLLAITRYVSLSSMIGAMSSMLWNRVLGDSPQMLPMLALLTGFILFRHRGNLRRLREGTESKFSFRRKGSVVAESPEADLHPTPSG